MVSAGGFDRELGMDVAERKGRLIAYGRSFISNVIPLTFSYGGDI